MLAAMIDDDIAARRYRYVATTRAPLHGGARRDARVRIRARDIECYFYAPLIRCRQPRVAATLF